MNLIRYMYDLSCRKDASSGRYCDELMFSWLAEGDVSTKAANCSHCALRSRQTQMNSSFGYDEKFAQGLSSSDVQLRLVCVFSHHTNGVRYQYESSQPSQRCQCYVLVRSLHCQVRRQLRCHCTGSPSINLLNHQGGRLEERF